jgi:hypothetical protein
MAACQIRGNGNAKGPRSVSTRTYGDTLQRVTSFASGERRNPPVAKTCLTAGLEPELVHRNDHREPLLRTRPG